MIAIFDSDQHFWRVRIHTPGSSDHSRLALARNLAGAGAVEGNRR